MMRLAVVCWIVGTAIIATLVVTRLIAFGPEQKTLFDTILLVLTGMAIVFGAVLAWQLWASRKARKTE